MGKYRRQNVAHLKIGRKEKYSEKKTKNMFEISKNKKNLKNKKYSKKMLKLHRIFFRVKIKFFVIKHSIPVTFDVANSSNEVKIYSLRACERESESE